MLIAIQNGEVFSVIGSARVADLPWNFHPTFPGVSLKHLIIGKDTSGKFSSHLVRVNGGCEIGEHIHEGKWELHEIIAGQGKCIIEGKEIDYIEGVSAIIPAETSHIVKAVDNDLYILAKFVPALL